MNNVNHKKWPFLSRTAKLVPSALSTSEFYQTLVASGFSFLLLAAQNNEFVLPSIELLYAENQSYLIAVTFLLGKY